MLEKNSITYITTRLLNGVETAKALGVVPSTITGYRKHNKHLDSSELSKISSYLKKKRNNAEALQKEIDAFEKYLTKKQWDERK